MGRRDDAAARTREALQDAGLRVAERHGLAGMSVNRIVAEAGLAKGTFYVHFPDRAAFLGAIHERFHDGIHEAVEAAIADLSPGRERLRAGMGAYLDACLHASATKAFLLEARNDEAVADQVALRNDAFAKLGAPDLRAMGWSQPLAAARMVVAMTAETALVELVHGRRQPTGRAVLWQMLDRADLGAAPRSPERFPLPSPA
jgi:TetR/AcrR family transcriptional regulator, transcriptional repressor for nem operon